MNQEMKRQKGCFYILTNKGKNVLYIGSTRVLIRRIKEHRGGYQEGFTQRYNVNQLVCYEIFQHIDKAKDREKEVKGWKQEKKIKLIEGKNRHWRDLCDGLIGDPSLASARSG